jgi:hypothetical protein
MNMQHAIRPALGDTVRAASRQVWLAGLGAVVVTREWAGKEAGNVFRTLVREGTAVESRTIRLVGDRLDTSMTRANALWREARSTIEGAVKGYADTAATLVRRTLPLIGSSTKSGVPRAKPVKSSRAKASKRAQSARRASRRAAKR